MLNQGSLIDDGTEVEQFNLLAHQFPRQTTKLDARDPRNVPKLSVEERVLTQAQFLKEREPGAWSGLIVDADADDGMTWAAAMAERQTQRSLPEFARYRIAPRRVLEGLPHIAVMIPPARLHALAHRAGIADSPRATRSRWAVAAAGGIFVLGALTSALGAVAKSGQGTPFKPQYLVAGGVLALLAFFAQQLTAMLKPGARAAAQRQAMEQIRQAVAARDASWDALVDELVTELREFHGDRCVIVDAFHRLDETTTRILRDYLVGMTAPTDSRELWVFFEDREVATLSKWLLLRHTPQRHLSASVRFQSLRMLNLSDERRAALVNLLGLPPQQAEFRRVKSVVNRDTIGLSKDLEQLLDAYVEEQHGDARPYGPVDLLHLLAVSNLTGPLEFSAADLVSDLAPRARANAPSEPTPAQAVLQRVLHGATPSPADLDYTLDRLRSDLSNTLDGDYLRDGRLEPLREAAQVVVNRRGQYGLESEGLVHLFWGLYWFAKIGGSQDADAYRLRKLGRHLAAATPPSSVDGLSAAVSERYVSAAIWTSRELLRSSIPSDIPTLLRRAEREADDPPTALRRLCWEAYAVLGSEEILSTLLKLHPGRAGEQAITPLDQLFIDSTSFRDDLEVSRAELTERLRSLGPDIVAYARVRALWLALTLSTGIKYSWSIFDAICEDAAGEAETLVRGALDRLAGSPGRRSAIDALTVSIGLWCFVFTPGGTKDLRRLNALLEDVRLRAYETHEAVEQESSTGGGEDFVLRALIQEIQVVCSASAKVGLDYSDRDVATPDELAQVQDHATSALSVRRRGGSLDESLLFLMSMQALTWTQLGYSGRGPVGFEQLSSFMTMRQAQFRIFCGRGMSEIDELAVIMTGLAAQFETPGVTNLLAHGIAMFAARGHREFSALLAARAVEAAVEAGTLGEALISELCLACVMEGHSFNMDLRVPLQWLLTSSPRTWPSSRLAARVADFEDELKETLALCLLNVAGEPVIPPSLVDRVVREVAAIAQAVATESTGKAIAETLEAFKLKSSIGRGETPDIDATLAWWSERERSPRYAFTLYLLLGRDPSERVEVAALEYLREHPEHQTSTGPLLLAFKMAAQSVSRGRRRDGDEQARLDEALEYLDREHSSWESHLPADTNEKVLKLLIMQSVGDPAERREQLAEWAARRQKRDGMEKLPQLIADGCQFLVVWHYYESLVAFDVETEPELDYDAVVAMLPEFQDELLLEWRSSDEPVPPVVTTDGRGTRCLSGDFIRYGRMLFHPPVADEPEFHDARDEFNRAAADALPRVYEVLIASPEMPEVLQRLLHEHRERLTRRPARTW